MTEKPYLISGVIGNGHILGCLDKAGQLVRLFWPQIDYPQNAKTVVAGVFIPHQGQTMWLHQPEWEHSQHYLEDTNILVTKAVHRSQSISVLTEDFAVPNRDILVRDYIIRNEHSAEREIQFYYFSDLSIGEGSRYNTTIFEFDDEALVQFRRKAYFATGAQIPVNGYQCGWGWDSACNGVLNGNAHSMGSDGSLMWDLAVVQPGEAKQITVFTCCGTSQEEVLAHLAWAREQTGYGLREAARGYWHGFLSQAKVLNSGDVKLDTLYKRSLLVFKLMTDADYGSIIAAPEIDEEFTRSGGYAFCWARDAAYITAAYDLAGLKDMSHRFYQWVLGTQCAKGSCQQRYYMDGSVAPNWGLQIDELGSVLWGMWQHYLIDRNPNFLQEVWDYVAHSMKFVYTFLDPETGLPKPSMDLWEERLGVHTYSAAALWGGITGAVNIAQTMGRVEEQEKWQQLANELHSTILHRMWDTYRGRFLRGIKLGVNKAEYDWRTSQGEEGEVEINQKGYPAYFMGVDPVVDVSMLGLTVPFGFLAPEDERMKLTAKTVENHLSSGQIGGIMRYAGDNYIGGNPWILTTLWLALYYHELKEYTRARELLDWVVQHQTDLGLLPEQVNKDTGETAWVVPLTWSHAMYVLTVLKLQAAGQLQPEQQHIPVHTGS
jgi:oligosaccharide amylase